MFMLRIIQTFFTYKVYWNLCTLSTQTDVLLMGACTYVLRLWKSLKWSHSTLRHFFFNSPLVFGNERNLAYLNNLTALSEYTL